MSDEPEVAQLRADLTAAKVALEVALRGEREMHDTLTAAQRRCTELVLRVRSLENFPAAGDDGDERWGCAAEASPDRWHGAYRTREDAVAAARGMFPGRAAYVQRGYVPDAARFMPSAEDVLDQVAQAAADEVGDAAEDFPCVDDDAERDLDRVLQAWAAHLHPCEFWIADGQPELAVGG